MAAVDYYDKVARNFIDSAKTRKRATGIDVIAETEEDSAPRREKRGFNRGTVLVLAFFGYFIGYLGGIYLVIRFIGSFLK
ncbi:MAG: hypothetical protein MUD12_15485 [Spirochaetes bacterium]|jgi:hypothetical protein|nr:hypothetical protein [Spirochaetota bacterium]